MLIKSIALILFVLSLQGYAQKSACVEQASLYIDNEYAEEICKDSKNGFSDCAEIVKNDINQMDIMSESDIKKCSNADVGFKSCFHIATAGLDRHSSLDICLPAKNGFRRCAYKAFSVNGYEIMTEKQILKCTGF